MTEPTDAELTAIYKAANGESTGKSQPLTTQRIFRAMRAAIAQRGSQPAVVGEPVAWLSTDSIGERYLCFTKPNDSDPARPLVFGDATPQPTQAQAGAAPTREFLERTLAAMEGVIDVADRKTDEFDALRSCVIDLTLMLFSDANRHAKEADHEL